MRNFILLLFLVTFESINAQIEKDSTTVQDSTQTAFTQEMIYNSGVLRKQLLKETPTPKTTHSPYQKKGQWYGSINQAQNNKVKVISNKEKKRRKRRNKKKAHGKTLNRILSVPAAIITIFSPKKQKQQGGINYHKRTLRNNDPLYRGN